jgi:hypothetical protein
MAGERAATAAGGDVLARWREANTITRAGHEGFNEHVIRKTIDDADPEAIFNYMVSSGHPSRIKEARALITEGPAGPGSRIPRRSENPVSFPLGQYADDMGQLIAQHGPDEAWRAVQGRWLEDVWNKAQLHPESAASTFAEEVAKFDASGALPALFSPAEATMLKGWASAWERAATRPTGGLGSAAIQFGQVGVMVTLVGGVSGVQGYQSGDWGQAAKAGVVTAVPSVTTVILGPRALARMLTNPDLSRRLLLGFETPPGTQAGARVVGQILSRMAATGILEDSIVVNPEGVKQTVDPTAQRAQDALIRSKTDSQRGAFFPGLK